MPGPLRETKLTDFFQTRPSTDIPHSSPTLQSTQSVDPSRSLMAKRRPGRPRGSARHNCDNPVHLPGGSRGTHVPLLLASDSSPLGSGAAAPSRNRQPRKPKGERKKASMHNKEAYLLRSFFKSDPRDAPTTISPFDSAPQHRSRKRKLDDSDDTASITSSGVPLSLYYNPRQISSPSSSKPVSLLTTDDLSSHSNKRRHLVSPRISHTLQAPVTPKKTRANEVIPTSQSSEAGLYSPIRPKPISGIKDDVLESVENWRHGRSAYRRDTLQFAPEDDYSMENDRPLSPLTSCPKSTSLGSPLSSFTDVDTIPLDVDFDNLPAPLSQQAFPTPSSTSEGTSHPPLTQVTIPPPVRPVTPPPSSPEQEQSIIVPVAPKDSKVRTAEIIAEIWANVRAKSGSDNEDSYLHAPVKDDLSSEEEDDEPFWKRNTTTACHVTPPSTVGGVNQIYPHPSLPSPSSPPISRPVSHDDSLPQHTDHNAHGRCMPNFPISDPVSPLVNKCKRPTRTRHLNRVINSSTLPGARNADPIKAMLRERKREARAGGGIDALNRAEGYDHGDLLSDFSIDEAEEPVARTRSISFNENATFVFPNGIQTDNAGADTTASTLEDEVRQDERERLLGAKEGEAVGKILDADRKMGQTATHNVPGVSVFVDDHEGTVDAELGTEARPQWELAEDKTATLEMLSEAIEHQDFEYMQAVFGILTTEDIVVPGVAQWLCEQALWYGNEHSGRLSRKFLLNMPLWTQSYLGSPLSVALLVQTMMRLGLRKDLSTHMQPPGDASFPRLQSRPGVLQLMVKMIASFAPRWSMEQLPGVVIVLLLIGVDINTTTELRIDILHSISLLSRRLPAEPRDGIEISVAKKVLDLTRPLSPPEQALLLSFFIKGSPSCLRIARAVAYHVLTGSTLSLANYGLPPLSPLILVLSNPGEQFSITDSTDYDALTSRIAVLGIALSGIESYVAEESALRKLMPEGSPRKKEPAPLELIRARLDALHGKIVDTRAAHLDRSRAKGAIQRLSMRLHYQRAALSKAGGQLRLGVFFSPGGNCRQPNGNNWS